MIFATGKRIFKLSYFKNACAVFALPILFFISNMGFIDIGGTVLTFAALILLLYRKETDAGPLIGFLLALSVLLRRWYSFFALTFIIDAFLYEIINKRIKHSVTSFLYFGGTLLFFVQAFVSQRMLADYKGIYQAYALGFKYDIIIFARYFGGLLTLLLFIYAIYRQIKGKKEFTPETFAVTVSLLSFLLFTRIQTHDVHHLLLYVPSFIILILSFISNIKKKSLTAIFLCICFIQTANTLIPRVQPTSLYDIKFPAAIPDFSNLPPRDNNTDGMLKMVEYLDKNIGEKGKTLYFLSSSVRYNDDALKNVEISLSVPKKSAVSRSDYVLPVSHIDKRDGLSENLFNADYILIPSILQLHENPDGQKVISVPYEMMLNGEGFAKAYERTDITFDMGDGLEMYLYKKIRPVTDEEKAQLQSEIF